jgi:hypothetical protein
MDVVTGAYYWLLLADLACGCDGALAASLSRDKSIKVGLIRLSESFTHLCNANHERLPCKS